MTMADDVQTSEDEDPASAVRKSEHLGRRKLMLRLPAHRSELDEIGANESALDGLFDAYNEATAMLHRLVQSAPPTGGAVALEYRKICLEIEADVVRYLGDRAKNGSAIS